MFTHFRFNHLLLQATLLLMLVCANSTTSIAQIDCDDPDRSVISYLGSTSNEIGGAVLRIAEHGYIVTGTKATGTDYRLYIARLSLCGELIWNYTYNTSEVGWGTGIVFKDDVIYIQAYNGSPWMTSILKLDLDGNVLEANKFGASTTYPRSLILSNDNHLIGVGSTNSGGGFGGTDMYLTKTTLSSSFVWKKRLGIDGNDFSHNVMEDTDGNLVVCGYTRDYIPGVYKGFVLKLDANGNLIWGKEYYKNLGQTTLDYCVQIGSNYYFSGSCDVTGTSGGKDAVLLKTDLNGVIIWSKFIGTSQSDRSFGIKQKDGLLYVSALAYSPTKNTEQVVLVVNTDGDLIDYRSFGSSAAEVCNFSAGSNFNVESDGFYGYVAANSGFIGGEDLMFFRSDVLASICEPSDVELVVLDANLLTNGFTPSISDPSWTMTSTAYTKSDLGLLGGIICTNVDSLDTCEIVVNAEYVIDGVSSEDGATSGCLLNEIQFNDLSTTDDIIVDWDWDFGDGTGSSAENPTHTYTTEGTFTITLIVTTELGCSDTVTLELDMVGSSIAVDFIADITEGCEPLTVQFDNTGESGVSCSWDFGDGTFASSCGSVTHTYLTDGVYDVSLTVTSESGCFGTLIRNSYINVYPVPVANFVFTPNAPTTLDTEVAFTNYSIDADSWLWIFDALGTSPAENPTIIIPGIPANYDITLIAMTEHGCNDTITKTINVVQDETIYVPNTFTPDGDSFNELFRPYITGIDPYDFHMTIYNRWGEIIFESYDATGGWNGAYGGKLVQDGVYVWHIVTSDLVTDKKLEYYGHITVLR